MTQQAREKAKKRLVELLKSCPDNYLFMVDGDFDLYESLADCLLENGVIVPPCKVGDMVYSIGWFDGKVHEEKVSYCSYNSEEDLFWFVTDATSSFSSQDIGVCEFFSREAAEQALKERD